MGPAAALIAPVPAIRRDPFSMRGRAAMVWREPDSLTDEGNPMIPSALMMRIALILAALNLAGFIVTLAIFLAFQ
jgi:hypothetical protein